MSNYFGKHIEIISQSDLMNRINNRKANKKGLIMFYMPGCPWCEQERDQSWNHLIDNPMYDGSVFSVNRNNAGSFCQQQDVSAFPTIKSYSYDPFESGLSFDEFEGNRGLDEFKSMLNRLLSRVKKTKTKKVKKTKTKTKKVKKTKTKKVKKTKSKRKVKKVKKTKSKRKVKRKRSRYGNRFYL